MIIFAPVSALRAHQLTKAQHDVRDFLTAFHFIGSRIRTSNGHVCMESDHKLVQAPEEGILLKISTPPTGRIYSAVIDTDAGIVYWLAIPADKPKDLEDVDYKKQRVAVGTVDVLDSHYPDVDRLLNQARTESKAVNEIGISTVYMALVDKVAKKFGIKLTFAKLSFNGTTNPLRVDYETPEGKATLIIMPARI